MYKKHIFQDCNVSLMVGAHTLCVIAIGVLCPLASLHRFMVPFLNHVSCDDGVGNMAF
jgi:hypothetical protein